ncbi:MAG: hypothetical protein U5K35_07080 [Rhodohalobacter sp.]|nr:hypothetical protein [Rhodohalobacter sp.]
MSRSPEISFDGDYAQTDPLELGIDLLKYAQKHDPNFEIKLVCQ